MTWREFALVVPAQIPFALLILSGWEWLSHIVTLLLVVSAVTVIASLALVAIVLIRRLDYHFDTAIDLQPHIASAIVVAVAVMALLSGGRFLLEHFTGLQPLP
jgi:hypothetical protein